MTAPEVTQVPLYPSKPVERGASTTVSQRDRRFTDTFFDDYRHERFPNGRPFTGQREFQSGSETESINAGFLQSDLQCGEYFCESPLHVGGTGQTPHERMLTLQSAWTAPWLMPGGKKYMKFDYRRKRITWQYLGFIADETAGLASFWKAAAKLAGESDVIDPKRPDAVPFRIRTLLGSPRVYSGKIRLAQAAMAGDPWLMGAVETPNEELAKILGLDVQYIGGTEFGDAEYVSAPSPKVSAPLLTPDAVLSVPLDQVAAMIAAALKKRDAEDAEKKAAAKAKMQKVRGARKQNKPSAGAAA